MDGKPAERQGGWRGSEELWLDAAYDLLIEAGIDAVKVKPLAERLGMSRTSFYGHFDSREQLLSALIENWKKKNTGNLVARTEAYAETIAEAMYNLFDCWLDPSLFDSKFDFAIRTWALADPELKADLEEVDRVRIDAIADMFARFGFEAEMARVRAYSVYYTQIGYISMMVSEPVDLRIRRMPLYIETFCDKAPTQAETARFAARYGYVGAEVLDRSETEI